MLHLLRMSIVQARRLTWSNPNRSTLSWSVPLKRPLSSVVALQRKPFAYVTRSTASS
jgi:hypothetical protein